MTDAMAYRAAARARLKRRIPGDVWLFVAGLVVGLACVWWMGR